MVERSGTDGTNSRSILQKFETIEDKRIVLFSSGIEYGTVRAPSAHPLRDLVKEYMRIKTHSSMKYLFQPAITTLGSMLCRRQHLDCLRESHPSC